MMHTTVGLNGKIWHITDVHVDPWYVVGADSTHCYCETYESCPNRGIQCNITGNAGKYGHSEGNCGSPHSLYSSALSFMKSLYASPDFVFFTGDHVEQDADTACSASSPAQQQILDIMTYDYNLLSSIFPNSYIFPLFGNHDSTPRDNIKAPPAMDWLYHNMSILWNIALTEGGFYSQNIINANLKIITLNTNYLSTLNNYLKNSSSSEYQQGLIQLEWMENELKNAMLNDLNVYILGHIPLWIWYNQFATIYQVLMYKYSSIIKGQFFGHFHTDSVTLTRKCPDNSGNNQNQLCMGAPTSVLYLGPSVIPGFPPSNVALRLYQFDVDEFNITESQTYYANLTKANMEKEMLWMKEYDAKSTYNMSDLSVLSWYDAVLDIQNDDNLWNIFYDLWNKQYENATSCTGICKTTLLCKTQYAASNAQSHCINASYANNTYHLFLNDAYNY